MVKSRFSRDKKTGTKEQLPSILIVCEGARTEPNYFQGFKVLNATVEIKGLGDNTLRLVEYAVTEKGKYDQVWVVFDRDSFPAKDVNDAVQLAQHNNFGIAYSNESFELWYVLHFQYLDSGISRTQYINILNNIFKKNSDFPEEYQKNLQNMYDLLKPLQANAIRNAKNLASRYTDESTPSPAKQLPVTYVYKLVEELNKWLPSVRLD
ncbi:TPA: RloB domain-containing protein [Streptococcus suis]|nr:RloB domain-containing protein [Streptococcus suis]NQL78692.1 RloB domain-containing protein [Streptococcus suis]HEL2461034.1 RloB domain-containing protein [Streptococcus suis]HEM2772352.1 RloB domain-containing protein [Streptococcus suis]HEM4281142.1 RloB domain-containing protein [Streptococcus suis]